MTDPDLQRVIEEAIAGETEYPVNEHIAHQARAVLAALTEAGTVEWGVEYRSEGKLIDRVVFTDHDDATDRAKRYPGDVLVSRLTLPWTAVE